MHESKKAEVSKERQAAAGAEDKTAEQPVLSCAYHHEMQDPQHCWFPERDFFSAPEDIAGLEGVQTLRLVVKEIEGLDWGGGWEN